MKFQTFEPESLASAQAPLADYQRSGTSDANQLAMLKGLLIAGHDEPDPHRAARLLAVFTDGLRPPGT